MKEKSHVKYFIIKLAIWVCLGVSIFIFRHVVVEHLRYFIGALMLLYAVEEILFEAIYEGKRIIHKDKAYLGLIEIILGLVLMFSEVSYEGVCIMWAVWSILRESYEIKEIIVELKCLFPRILSGVESIAVIVFSILLILEPGEHHAMIHLYLLLVELTLAPLVPMLDEIIYEKTHKEEHEENKEN